MTKIQKSIFWKIEKFSKNLYFFLKKLIFFENSKNFFRSNSFTPSPEMPKIKIFWLMWSFSILNMSLTNHVPSTILSPWSLEVSCTNHHDVPLMSSSQSLNQDSNQIKSPLSETKESKPPEVESTSMFQEWL